MGDPRWTVERFGVGDVAGEVEMCISGTSPSSSFLSLANRHVELFPDSREIGREKFQLLDLMTGPEDFLKA